MRLLLCSLALKPVDPVDSVPTRFSHTVYSINKRDVCYIIRTLTTHTHTHTMCLVSSVHRSVQVVVEFSPHPDWLEAWICASIRGVLAVVSWKTHRTQTDVSYQGSFRTVRASSLSSFSSVRPVQLKDWRLWETADVALCSTRRTTTNRICAISLLLLHQREKSSVISNKELIRCWQGWRKQ